MVDYTAVTWDSSTQVDVDYTTVVSTGSDCDSKLIHALTSLRQLDTRFIINDTPDIVGRSTGQNISFDDTSYSEYKMRRKAEVLKYKKKDTGGFTKKQYFAQLAKGTINRRNSNFAIQNPTYTDPNPLNYTESGGSLIIPSTSTTGETCINTSIKYVPASRSDIPSSTNEYLYLDPDVQFYIQL